MTTSPAVLIGIGNPYRRDDGIGPALIEAIEEVRPPGVTLTVSDGEPAQLIDAWSGATLAIVIDAVLCEQPAPGRIHRTAVRTGLAAAAVASPPEAETGTPAASTHGLGILEALRLAQALDRAPGRLVIFAVEAASIGFGIGLSPAVAERLPELAGAVLAELSSIRLADSPP